MAADLPAAPVKAPVAVMPIVQNWTGFYIGVNGGYAWDQSSSVRATGEPLGPGLIGVGNLILDGLNGVAPVGAPTSTNLGNGRLNGALVGGQFGYNWQMSKTVLGFEVDGQWIDRRFTASRSADFFAFGGNTFTLAVEAKQSWFATIRGRFGFLLTPELLLYGTGGAAVGGSSAEATIRGAPGPNIINFATSMNCPAGSVICFSGRSADTTRWGWAAGGGFEWALSKAVSFKAEYLYVDLGNQNLRLTTVAPATGTAFVDVVGLSNQLHIARAGLNLHF